MTIGDAGNPVRSVWPSAPGGHRELAAAAIVALTVALMAAVAFWGTTAGAGGVRFIVVEHESDEVAYERSIDVGESFLLEHTHSVTKRPVVETFSVADPETLALEELWFDEFGPNLPAGPEQLGDHVTFLREDGAFRVLHHGSPIGSVPLRVGSPDVDHTLTFADGERVRLLDIARAGAWVDLMVRTS